MTRSIWNGPVSLRWILHFLEFYLSNFFNSSKKNYSALLLMDINHAYHYFAVPMKDNEKFQINEILSWNFLWAFQLEYLNRLLMNEIKNFYWISPIGLEFSKWIKFIFLVYSFIFNFYIFTFYYIQAFWPWDSNFNFPSIKKDDKFCVNQ